MTDSVPGASPGAHQATPVPGPAPPPPPPPPGRSSPPLTRSTTDRRVAGVCGGLGAHFHTDPLVFRVAFVVLTLAGGLGAVLYAAAWLLIPEAGSRSRIGWESVVQPERHNTRILLAGLIIVVAVVLFANGLHFTHDGLFWGVALVGVGGFLLLQERRQPASGVNPVPTSEPLVPYAAASFAASSNASPVPNWTAVRSPRPRSILGLVTVAAALLAVGVAVLLDSAGVVSVSLASYAAIALVIVGAGLIAGSWFGRSRVLVGLGLLLLPLAATATLVTEPLAGGTGNVIVAPQSLADLHSQYHLAAGQLTVDLSQIPVSASPDVSVTVALGRLTVVVPMQANIHVAAHVGAGHIDLFGATDDGVNIDSPISQSPNPGGGTFHLALSVGFGEVDVVDSAGIPVKGL